MTSIPATDVATAVSAAIERDGRRVVVFDDDPTGTQTVSDVDVLFGADDSLLDRFFASDRRALWILTNTRAFAEEEATERLKAAHSATASAAARAGVGWFPILRGDSTLRGHVFAEVDAVAPPKGATLFVPAFPEGGRVTHDGQQWLRIDGRWHNVADTEFARDAFFGYASHRLVDWVAEVGGGRHATVVPLDEIRERGGSAVRDALLNEPDGGVVIPEQESVDDVGRSVLGLLDAEAAGRAVTVRSAATFAAARTGLRTRIVEERAIRELGVAENASVLVACGSHTDGAGRQLGELEKEGVDVRMLDDPADDATAVERTAQALQRDGVAAIATPRSFIAGTDFKGGRAWMRRLSGAVRTLASGADVIVAKGGITSADLASALGARRARVEGQLEPGIALWTLDVDPAIPYVVVPGNVGDAAALVRVVSRFRPTSMSSAAGR